MPVLIALTIAYWSSRELLITPNPYRAAFNEAASTPADPTRRDGADSEEQL